MRISEIFDTKNKGPRFNEIKQYIHPVGSDGVTLQMIIPVEERFDLPLDKGLTIRLHMKYIETQISATDPSFASGLKVHYSIRPDSDIDDVGLVAHTMRKANAYEDRLKTILKYTGFSDRAVASVGTKKWNWNNFQLGYFVPLIDEEIRQAWTN